MAGEGKFGPKFIELKGQAALFTLRKGKMAVSLICERGQNIFGVITC